jgi:hypothetical protein
MFKYTERLNAPHASKPCRRTELKKTDTRNFRDDSSARAERNFFVSNSGGLELPPFARAAS